MPISREKEARMWALADELAESGHYSGWLPIEWELRAQGYSRARDLLDRESVRDRLNALCATAQASQINS